MPTSTRCARSSLYGIKGYAAYADHARILGKESDEIYAFTHKALAAQLDDSLGLMDYVGLAMETGRINLVTMELLNQAHVDAYGHPVPTKVNLGTKAGKAILVSGHDLKMLEELLKQTAGTGVNVYTHGEMLPAHGYPGLKKYPHLVGNFGGAWQDQAKEFAEFPGAIIFNTNCIQRPADSYKDRLFTWGLVQWPGVKHVDGWDFSAVIKKAQECDGFDEQPGQEILVGFGHNAVLGVADKVIDAVKAGAIKHFFLIGGCDGAKSGRNYYTEFAEQAPKDTVILTLACGKYRFNKLDFGDIGGIPRLLDVGQCNDAYSAIQIAVALAGAFKCGVNDLPLSHDPLLVRAEGGGDPAHPAPPGDQEHQARADPAGLRHPQRARLPGAELQHRADHHGRAGPQADSRLSMSNTTKAQIENGDGI